MQKLSTHSFCKPCSNPHTALLDHSMGCCTPNTELLKSNATNSQVNKVSTCNPDDLADTKEEYKCCEDEFADDCVRLKALPKDGTTRTSESQQQGDNDAPQGIVHHFAIADFGADGYKCCLDENSDECLRMKALAREWTREVPETEPSADGPVIRPTSESLTCVNPMSNDQSHGSSRTKRLTLTSCYSSRSGVDGQASCIVCPRCHDLGRRDW